MLNTDFSISQEAQAALSLLQRALFEQRSRLMMLFTPLGHNRLLVETLQGWESLDDGGFCFYATVLSDDAHIPLKTLIAQPVCIRLENVNGQGRYIHGHVTAFELQGANGGFARYHLTIQPWLAFLDYQQDSYVFQEQSVFDIVEHIFNAYTGNIIKPEWRWEVEDRSVYPVRSMTTQYGESDLSFVQRLLAEEGLYYWFEHESGAENADTVPGRHILVISDYETGKWQVNRQAKVPFQRADATEALDSMTVWHGHRQLQNNALTWHSWDYRQVDHRPLQLDSNHQNSYQPIELRGWDDVGMYAWQTSEQGERLQRNALIAIEARNKIFHGQSTVRSFVPGTYFTLSGHAEHDRDVLEDRQFVLLSVTHQARNNFNEELRLAACSVLGEPSIGSNETECHYVNTIEAIRAHIPYRPLLLTAEGRRVHAKPLAPGPQTALVVGGAAEPLHTDRDHRVRIQFHWQRGSRSSSRLAHPYYADDNAPGSDRLGVWVRVASSIAGDNWGQVMLPRIGQEVKVDFIQADIDRPVITGVLYNGQGNRDAQGNHIQNGASVATGNAPVWFAGETGEYQHHAVYSGIKTQELANSQDGKGGFSQLLFDDTPQQESAGVYTTQTSARLLLGHQRLQHGNQRGAGRGHGAELASEAEGAIRCGAGLLISADEQRQAQGSFMDNEAAIAVLAHACDTALSLASNAKHQHAGLIKELETEQLPALVGLSHIQEVISATTSNHANNLSRGDEENSIKSAQGGEGEVAAYSEAHMQFSAPKGVVWASPAEIMLVNGVTAAMVAEQAINVTAQQQIAMGASEGIAFYTVGDKAKKNQPVTEQGICLHAASGNVHMHSLSGAIELAAQDDVLLSSTEAALQLTSKQQTLLTAQGAYVKLGDGGIQIHAPGAVTFRAGGHVFKGPQAAAQALSGLDAAKPTACELDIKRLDGRGGAVVQIE